MEACLERLKTFRKGDPHTCQRIWDVIKLIRVDRKAATLDNVVRYYGKSHNVEYDVLKKELELLVEDKLIIKKISAPVKGSNKGVEQTIYCIPLESEVNVKGKETHDWYCFKCHKPGPVLPCTLCSHVYHVLCVESEQLLKDPEFICPYCKEPNPQPGDDERIDLNLLLSFACSRLEDRLPNDSYIWNPVANNVNGAFTTDRCAAILKKISTKVDHGVSEESWRAKFLLRFPNLTIPKMNDKADRQVYRSLNHFQLDAATVLHNVVIFHGENSLSADQARVVQRDCAHELKEINLCRDCYRRSNQQEESDWFCLPCVPQHELVFAKAKGFPFWPAKVLKVDGNLYDVRFFGSGHDRLTVDKSYIRPINCNINSLVPKRSTQWTKAFEELQKHQIMLEEVTSSEEENESELVNNVEKEKTLATENQPTKIGNIVNENKYTKCKDVRISLERITYRDSSFQENSENSMISAVVDSKSTLAPSTRDEATQSENFESTDPVPSASFVNEELLESRANLEIAKEKIISLEKELESLKRQHAEELESNQQNHAAELEFLKQGHAAELMTMEEECKKKIDLNKTKSWCSNTCGEEGIYHCCMNVSYCSTTCQQSHWKANHKRVCKREREVKRAKKGGD